ncbi:MAG: zf-HC2 domain-containing protein, partial [Planctomycetota bacterium]|nr:zf-HC2 domain-containing protein [Planctomycetota bacterium]
MNDEVKPLECAQVRDHLSDLLDLRRGETPPPGATPLSEPAYRTQVETHVNACPECRNELYTLGDLGRVFSEFDVGERPAQDFDGYAKAVRARLNGQGKIIALPGRALRPRERRSMGWRGWTGVGLTSAAAAVLAVSLLGYLKADGPRTEVAAAQPEASENRVPAWKEPIAA